MEKQPDIRIFIACHKPTYVPENPIFYPVQVGTALMEKRLEHMAYRDNEGDNISGKNPDYCELTAQYWAWKNIDCDYYGFFHYADSKETVLRLVSSRRFGKESITRNRAFVVKRNPKLLENANTIK